jgi:hypothetical protein
MDGGGVDIIKCMHSINVARNFRCLSLVRVHVHVLYTSDLWMYVSVSKNDTSDLWMYEIPSLNREFHLTISYVNILLKCCI